MRKPDPVVSLTDAMIILTHVLEEESERLALSGPSGVPDPLRAARNCLTHRMVLLCDALNRHDPQWEDALPRDNAAAFSEAREELHKAALINCHIMRQELDRLERTVLRHCAHGARIADRAPVSLRRPSVP